MNKCTTGGHRRECAMCICILTHGYICINMGWKNDIYLSNLEMGGKSLGNLLLLTLYDLFLMWLLETLCLLFSIFQIKSNFKTNRRFGLAKKHILWTTVSCYDVFARLCVTWPDLKQGLKMKACWFPGALRLYPKFLIMASTLETPTIPTSSPSLSHLPHCPKSKPHFTDLAFVSLSGSLDSLLLIFYLEKS